ncbi:uncharacterized protein LOC143225761 isoform X2 [Tachypleus tridentatus]|uniref:uncharacterized protein LOC143225761 isoform X2 n=1 Tax=Tachypleus tridentatus TaxID=6853 RepID=UPI003FD12CE1
MRQISSGGTFSCTFDVFMNIHLKTFLIVTHVVLALYLYCSIIGTPGISSSPHAIHHFEDCEDIENFHVVNIDIASSRRRRPYNSYSTEERFLIGTDETYETSCAIRKPKIIEDVDGTVLELLRVRRRRPYNTYSSEERFLIGQYAAEHGNTKAAELYLHFQTNLGSRN